MGILNTTLQIVVIDDMFLVFDNKQIIVSAETYERCLQKLFDRFKNEVITLGS